MKIDLDQIERVARAAQENRQGKWEQILPEDPFSVHAEVDGKYGSSVAVAATPSAAEHIATCSPDVAIALVERIRELEKRCHIVESLPPDHGIEGDTLEAQVFILKERLLDERHKSYQLECEVAELEGSHADADGNEFAGDALESEAFYELMQTYRHWPLGHDGVTSAFEAVKSFVRERSK